MQHSFITKIPKEKWIAKQIDTYITPILAILVSLYYRPIRPYHGHNNMAQPIA